MAKKGNKGQSDNQTDQAHVNTSTKETSDELALKKLFGTQIKRVRQAFFKDAQEKLGDQVFQNYGQNTMFRIEQGNGSVINMLKLLQFFHQQGVNLNFLFEDDLNEVHMTRFNPNAQDSVFIKSIITKYELAMTNLYKLKDLNAFAIEKNINDMRSHIESISKLTTIESIDLEKQ